MVAIYKSARRRTPASSVEGCAPSRAGSLNRTFRTFPAVTWATDRPGGFSEADIAALEEINPALAAIVETRAVRRISANLLDTYLGPQAGRRILAG